ncbi:MAG TPA: hypothetical protein VH414_01485 [Lichenihabitans sp.]|jgi:hypothetical protein|nr:hypothetical protein [Lichenihabitans sp.]
MIRLSLGLLFVLPSAAASAATCKIDPFRMIFGRDAQVHMTAASGRACGSMINWHDGGASSMAVETPPANGSVTTPTSNRWLYRSRPGFAGHDRFVLATSGVGMRKMVVQGTTNITVDVDVVP